MEISRLQEFGERCAALPDNMRAFLEPTDIGMRVWLEAIATPKGHVHAQRLVSWLVFRDAVLNPLIGALREMEAQINAETATLAAIDAPKKGRNP